MICFGFGQKATSAFGSALQNLSLIRD